MSSVLSDCTYKCSKIHPEKHPKRFLLMATPEAPRPLDEVPGLPLPQVSCRPRGLTMGERGMLAKMFPTIIPSPSIFNSPTFSNQFRNKHVPNYVSGIWSSLPNFHSSTIPSPIFFVRAQTSTKRAQLYMGPDQMFWSLRRSLWIQPSPFGRQEAWEGPR